MQVIRYKSPSLLRWSPLPGSGKKCEIKARERSVHYCAWITYPQRPAHSSAAEASFKFRPLNTVTTPCSVQIYCCRGYSCQVYETAYSNWIQRASLIFATSSPHVSSRIPTIFHKPAYRVAPYPTLKTNLPLYETIIRLWSILEHAPPS